jgi:hypothetical protein
MKVLKRGHVYELDHRDGDGKTRIAYVNKEPGQECEGVIQQEVLRMMLDRNRYCTACQPNAVSKRIEYHLQMALVLHEMRALERKVQKGEIMPEYLATGNDGHFLIPVRDGREGNELETGELEPYTDEWERPCNHHSEK